MVTLKIYVSLFSQADYGRFSIYSKTVSMLYLVLLGWIGMSAFRYAKTYLSTEGEQQELNRYRYYSTITIAYLGLTLIIILISAVIIALFPKLLLGQGITVFLPLILLLIGYSMYQLFITLLIYTEQRSLNMLLVLLSVFLKLGVTYLLYRLTSGHIISILISHGMVDVVLGIIAIKRLHLIKYVRFRYMDRQIIKIFIQYGYPLIGLSLVMFLLNSSDQYVITAFEGDAKNGIYAGNYTVAASLFTIITMGMNRGVYPKALKFWHDGDQVNAEKTVSQGFKYFLLIAVPSATGLYLISDYVSQLFLKADYIEGSHVIGIIAIAMVFYGMSEYMNKGHELKGNTIPIFVHCLIAALLNIVLNVILIPRFGYLTAAYTTLTGFILYFILSFVRRSPILPWKVKGLDLIKLLVADGFMIIAVLIVKSIGEASLLTLFGAMGAGITSYAIGIMALGVIKEEIKEIRGK